MDRRRFVQALGVLCALGSAPGAHAQAMPLVGVYKSPACGCCGEWVAHLRASGFRVEVRDANDVSPVKRRYGVPDRLASCHTAVVEGYAIEGHVPAADIQRLLRERPRVAGLAVPGMVPGSPGMAGAPQPYDTLAFDAGRSWVFQRH
jgi:hypothetical protein